MRKTISVLILILGIISFFSYSYLSDKIQSNMRKMEIETTNSTAVSIKYLNENDIQPLIQFVEEKNLNLVRVVQTEETTKYFTHLTYLKKNFYFKGECSEYINKKIITIDKENKCYTEDILNNDKIEFIPIKDIKELNDYNFSGQYLLTHKEGKNAFKSTLDSLNLGATSEIVLYSEALGIGDILIFLTFLVIMNILILLNYLFLCIKEFKKRGIYKINGDKYKRFYFFSGNFVLKELFVNIIVGILLKIIVTDDMLKYVVNILVVTVAIKVFIIIFIDFIFDRKVNKEINNALKGSLGTNKILNIMKLITILIISICSITTFYLFFPIKETNDKYSRLLSIQETSKYGLMYENPNRVPPGNYFKEQHEIFKNKNFFEQEGSFYIDSSEIDLNAINKRMGCSSDMPKEECNMPVYLEVDDGYMKKYASNIYENIIKQSNDVNNKYQIHIIYPNGTDIEKINNIKFRYNQQNSLSRHLEQRKFMEVPEIKEHVYNGTEKFFSFRQDTDFFLENTILVLKTDKAFNELSGGIQNFYVKKYDDNNNDITQKYIDAQKIAPEIFSNTGAFNSIQANLDIYNQEILVMKQAIQFLLIQLSIALFLVIFVIWQIVKLDLVAKRKERVIQKISGYNWLQMNKNIISQTIIIFCASVFSTISFIVITKSPKMIIEPTYLLIWSVIAIVYSFLFFLINYVAIEFNDRKNIIKTIKGGDL